jgi:hypothetical protein
MLKAEKPMPHARSALVSALLTLAAPMLRAEVLVLSDIPLSGDQSVPSVPTPGHGTATVTLDTQTRRITITGVYAELTSPVTAAHLHAPAAPGQNVMIAIMDLDHDGGTAGTFAGTRVLAPNQLAWVLDSLSYINIHTVNHADGEIRGQITVPAPGALAPTLIALLRTRRRR